MGFKKPIKYGRLTNESPKKYTYTSDSSDVILAPYDGVVYDVDIRKCDGYIQLAHMVNNNLMYSEICGVNKSIFVASGVDVKQGDILGHAGNNEVTFEIKDSNKNPLRIEPFFIDVDIDNKDKDIDKDDKKDSNNNKETDNKQQTKKEPKRKEEPDPNKEDNKEKKKWNFNRQPEEVPDLFGSLLLTPLDFVNKALTYKGKKKETKEEELNEEIKRMKQLLK